MRYLLLCLTLATLIALAACSGAPGLPPARPASTAATGYIVVLKPAATVNEARGISQRLALAPSFFYDTVFAGFAAQLTPAQAASLRRDPRVDFIEPDRPVHLVDKSASFAQVLPWGIDRIDADLNPGTAGGVGVAVIDTGIDLNHPDLAHVVAGANFVRSNSPPEDDNGHGTHVAGTIAAADNSFGYVGVAPGATVIAVKVLNRQGSGTLSGVVAGINWVAANQSALGIKVANMSLGASGFSQAMYNAIQFASNAGVTFVVAAGNSAANAANYSPAGFDNVITVSALNANGTFASYSNYGAVVDFIAPGTSIP